MRSFGVREELGSFADPQKVPVAAAQSVEDSGGHGAGQACRRVHELAFEQPGGCGLVL